MMSSSPRKVVSAVPAALVAGVAALLAPGGEARACPVAPPGLATGEVFCVPADGGAPPFDMQGDSLRIANSSGSSGSLTLSAGEVVTLESGSDPDPGLAGPFAAVGRSLGSDGTLTVDGAGAELRFLPEGLLSNLWLGRDGGRGRATVSNGGAIVAFSDSNAGATSGAEGGASLHVGRAGAGTVGRLTVDGGTIDLDTLEEAKLYVGRDGSFGTMTVRDGSLVSLRGEKADFFTEVNVGGSSGGGGSGELTVDASRVILGQVSGGSGFYVGRGAGALGTAAFSAGAELEVASGTDQAVVVIGAATGGFGSLSLTEASSGTVDGARSLLDIAREPGSEGAVALVDGATLTLTADAPEDADVAVGVSFDGRPIAGDGDLRVSGAGSTLAASGSVLVGGFGGISSGRLRVGDGGTVDARDVRIGEDGLLDGDGGFVLADVSVEGGTVAPGTSAGVLTVGGDFVLGPGGRLVMEVFGPSEYDVLSVSGLLDPG